MYVGCIWFQHSGIETIWSKEYSKKRIKHNIENLSYANYSSEVKQINTKKNRQNIAKYSKI